MFAFDFLFLSFVFEYLCQLPTKSAVVAVIVHLVSIVVRHYVAFAAAVFVAPYVIQKLH